MGNASASETPSQTTLGAAMNKPPYNITEEYYILLA